MCKAGGPRCAEHPDRAALRYRRTKRFREHLLTELQHHGVDPRIDPSVDISAASVSALPRIAEAAGLNPANVLSRCELDGAVPGTGNPRLSASDAEIIAAVEKAYVPSPQRIMDAVVKDPAQQERLAAAGYEMLNARAELERLRAADAPHRERKAAACREVEAERKFAETMNAYLDDISAAQRGEEFVTRTDTVTLDAALPEGVSVLAEGTRVDPVFITPLRALGLSDRLNADSTRKPLRDRGRDAALAAAGRRSSLPSHDERADELCLALAGDGVQRVGALVGDDTRNAYLDAVQYSMDGSVHAAVTCAGPLEDRDIPDDIRARALYAAHVAGAPVAKVTAVVRGYPVCEALYVGTASVEASHKDSVGTLFSDVVDNIDANREAMRTLADEPRPFRRLMKDSESSDVRDAESNLAALLPHIPANDVRRELARRQGEGGESLDDAVRGMLRDHFSRARMGTVAGVDGETAGMTNDRRAFTPEYSEWIETGIVTHRPDGTENERFEKLHGVHPRVLRLNGTGAENVHHISPAMVEGKPRFDNDHDDVRAALLEGDVLVAHNAKFERSNLGATLPEAVSSRPWLDTQWLAQHFLPAVGTGSGRTGLKLQHFVEDTGGTYEGAHRAGADAAMMMDALERFLATPNWWEKRD